VCLLSLLCVSCTSSRASKSGGFKLLVGSYYYLWFPQNLAQGTLRSDLVPPQGVNPATDQSTDPATAEKSIAQANKIGVNFFALDWWPSRPQQNVALGDFLKASNISKIKFCMFYETWALGYNGSNETTPVDPQMEDEFNEQMLSFAHDYFGNPSYLRLHHRPVVVLYLTRTLTNNVTGMIDGARLLLEKRGYDPYFIGDEIFWRVTQLHPPTTGTTLTTEPQAKRIKAFDAITYYSLYFGGNSPTLGPAADFAGYSGLTNIVADERNLFKKYCRASDDRVPIVPDISPGFNDRGVRLYIDHPAQARQWVLGAGPASLLDHLFREVAVPSVDPRAPIIFVTSWNDWNEDTGVQPVPGVPTTRDDSPSGTAYTQGLTYGGEGDSAFRVLKKDISAARVRFARTARTDRPNC
jgi:glycoprotein endo-alpha-1,2-mannosidase